VAADPSILRIETIMHHLRRAFAAVMLLASAVPLSAQDAWYAGPDMAMTRQRHSATLLSDGRLLVAGGAYDFWGEIATETCEIYDPSTDSWSNAASMSVARSSHTATLLPSGKVLVSGGFNGGGYALSSAELYDPISNSWTSVDAMGYGRYRHQAIVLNDDEILVVGGRQGNADGTGAMRIWAPVSTCEIYSVSADTWTPAAPMNETRVESGLARLPDGRVLAAGGINDTLVISDWGQPASRTCEIYDPVTDTWSLTDSLQSARNFVRLVTLDDNTVLSVGGEYDQFALYDSQIFDVYAERWLPADSLGSPRIVTEVVKLPNGDVISIGGWAYLWSTQTNTVEHYSVTDAAWGPVDALTYNRGWHTATLLGNGDIIVTGGTAADQSPMRSTEIYRLNREAYAIAAVSDAPGDEGGFVRLFWNSHAEDQRGAAGAVTGYAVYLRDDQNGQPLSGVASGKWRMVGSTDARGLGRYALTVPALETSTHASLRPSEYLIAAVNNGWTVAMTPVASGAAFDNRGPNAVQSLRTETGGNGLSLAWSGSTSADVDHYEIFSGDRPDFVVDDNSRIGTSSQASFSTSGAAGRYIRVRARDAASNPGLASPPIRTDGATAAPVESTATEFSLGSVYPLPARDAAMLPVTLASTGIVTVSIYDQLSREVARVDGLMLPAGRSVVRLDLGSLVPGSYVCTVSTGAHQSSTRMTVVR
jgi:hypothetical protein